MRFRDSVWRRRGWSARKPQQRYEPAPGVTFTVWDAPRGGQRVTDLRDRDGEPVDVVTAGDDGWFTVFAPDEYDKLWFDYGSNLRSPVVGQPVDD